MCTEVILSSTQLTGFRGNSCFNHCIRSSMFTQHFQFFPPFIQRLFTIQRYHPYDNFVFFSFLLWSATIGREKIHAIHLREINFVLGDVLEIFSTQNSVLILWTISLISIKKSYFVCVLAFGFVLHWFGVLSFNETINESHRRLSSH